MEKEQNNIIAIKIGGSTLGNHDTALEDVVTLQQQGVISVVVHGGGNRVSQWLKKQGATTSFVDGLRVTDLETLEMVAAVLSGLVNTELVAAINSRGGKAVGMSGVDGNLIQTILKDKRMGYVGQVAKVNSQSIEALINAGFVPVISSPCAGISGEAEDAGYLNVNGDEIAGAIAAALKAQQLIFLTDVEGIRCSDGNLIHDLSARQVKSMIESKVIDGGMIPKGQAALAALKTVPVVQIVDGRLPHILLDAVNGKANGTRIV